MKIELTDEMAFAIQVALDELSNSGDWACYLEEEEVDKVYRGKEAIEQLLTIKGDNLSEQYPDALPKVMKMFAEEETKVNFLLSKGYTREDFIMLTDEECEALYRKEMRKLYE